MLASKLTLSRYQPHYSDLSVVWLDWWIFTQLWVCVFIVHIVTDANEFLATICAGNQHHGNSNSITLRDQSSVWGISLLQQTQHKDGQYKTFVIQLTTICQYRRQEYKNSV